MMLPLMSIILVDEFTAKRRGGDNDVYTWPNTSFFVSNGRGGVNKGSMLTILYNLMDGKEPHLNTR